MKRKHSRGSALIEYALMVPLLFLLVVNVVNFGGLFYAWISVTHATRSAVQYVATGAAYLGYGSANGMQTLPIIPQQVKNILTSCPNGDLCSLPNQANITVTVATNNKASGTNTFVIPGDQLPPTDPTTGAVFTDPQPTTSTIATVTVSYRYCPFVPIWDFPRMNIHTTLTPCTSNNTAGGVVVQRVAAMRIIN